MLRHVTGAFARRLVGAAPRGGRTPPAAAARLLSSSAGSDAPHMPQMAVVARVLRSEPVANVIAKSMTQSLKPLQIAAELREQFAPVGQRELVITSYHYVSQQQLMPVATALLELVRERDADLLNEASVMLWSIYRGGAPGVDADPQRALQLLEASAARDHAPSQVTLGKLLSDGREAPLDLARARQLYEAAAAQNNPDAHYCIGALELSNGNMEAAAEHFEKAAAQDQAEAHLALGLMLSGSPKVGGPVTDLERSFEHYRKAADLGLAQAWFNMGTCYFLGKGVPHDFAKAAECFKTAADAGFEMAQVNLGHMYFQGRGVQRDLAAAEHYLAMAAPTNQVARASLEAVRQARAAGSDGSPTDTTQ